MKALVTGAAGFVGRHMVRALLARGWDVHSVDLRPMAGAFGDCREGHIVGDARTFFWGVDHTFDLVVHCAAHVGGRADIEGRPTFLGAVNLQLDGALFEWALRTRPGRIVYFSSSAVYPVKYQDNYGWEAGARLNESDVDLADPMLPDAMYGWVKLTGERLAAQAEAEGLRVHVFRPFSGYGEDQDPTYPFPAFIGRARRRENPFEIWGDGTQVRDWIHIDDVVGGVLAAIDADVPGPVNLCTGRPVSLDALAELVHRGDQMPEIRHLVDAPRGVLYRVGNPGKMLTFYEPRISLEEGIRRALGA